MQYWITSDYHLGHFNIIKYCNRPFTTIEEMNETIIRNHNSRVKEDDVIFHIGDFCFKGSDTSKPGEGELTKAQQYEKQLKGKIIFIQGNHDSNNSCKTCIRNMSINLGGHDLFLVHDPENFNLRYEINLVGHVHEKWKIRNAIKDNYTHKDRFLINVGVDVWDFMPIKINEILKELSSYKRRNK